MSGFSTGTDRFLTGQGDLLCLPRGAPVHRYPILLFHGATGHGSDWYNANAAPGATSLVRCLADCGAVVIATDWGGDLWGNATATGYIETVRGLVGGYGCDTSKVVLCGGSMGGLEVWQYILNHGDKVAGAALIAPVTDLNGFYSANTLGSQGSIAAAWGVTAPAALPSGADPLTNAAAIAATGVATTVYYSTADTVVPASSLTSMATAVPKMRLIQCSTTATHGDDETVAALPLGLPTALLAAAA